MDAFDGAQVYSRFNFFPFWIFYNLDLVLDSQILLRECSNNLREAKMSSNPNL